MDTEEPKTMNQEDDDQNAPPSVDQSWYEWERNVKQVEDVSVAYDQNGIDDQNDECDHETWNKRRERICNALWNGVWHLDRPAPFYADTVDLDCQGSDDEPCENAGCTDARKSGTILFVSRIKSKMIQKRDITVSKGRAFLLIMNCRVSSPGLQKAWLRWNTEITP